MKDNFKSPPTRQKSGFLREGWKELSRRRERGKFRKQAQKSDEERDSALTRLGEVAWNTKVDLSAFPELRDQMARLEARAGELAATAKKLEEEKTALEAQRQAESARFDSLRQAVLEKKRPVDAALTTVRERLAQQDATIKALQARLASLAAATAALGNEPAPSGRNSVPTGVAQPLDLEKRKQELQFEQTLASQELTKLNSALPQLSAEVRRNYEESQRHEQELTKITAEHKAAVAPIESSLDRVARDTNAGNQEAGAVAQQRRAVLAQLGLALYERKSTEPALAAGMLEVSGIDRSRASTQAGLAASLAASRAIPRGTMLKFWSTVVFLPLLLIGSVYGISAGWSWWQERHQLEGYETRLPINPYLVHSLSQNPAYVLADRITGARSEQEVAALMLQAFRAIGLGVYTHDGKKILGGAERNQNDFFLYDFEWKTLAHGFYGRTALGWDGLSRLIGSGLLNLKDPVPLRPILSRAVDDRYEAALRSPNDRQNFLILLVDGLARHQLKPYTLAELPSRQTKDIYVDPLQSLLIMLDFFTLPPRRSSVVPARLIPFFREDLIRPVYAEGPCDSINGEPSEGGWGEGVEKVQIILENEGHMGSDIAKGGGLEFLEKLSEKVEKIAKGVGSVLDVGKAIDAISLLAGINVYVKADPYVIHLPHSGQGKARFEGTVTFDPKDIPETTILCGRLHGEQIPGGPIPLKGVIVNWDWEEGWNKYFRFADETMNEFLKTYGGFERNTTTDENGKTQISLLVIKPCEGKGTVVGTDNMMEVSTVQLIPAEGTDLFAGLPGLSYVLKFGPGLAQFVIPNRTGSVRFRIEWHEKKPKKPQRGGDPNH